MNRNLLQQYIAAYEANFEQISHDEIYKWRAVEHFKRHWDIDADDFSVMLKNALHRVSNLMDSGYYYPRRMILQYAEVAPETVRSAFRGLYDEDAPLLERMEAFRAEMERLNAREFPGKSTYQDDRAIMVYLNMKYPDTYYLYKYTMFKEFADRVHYDYKLRQGIGVNVVPYLQMCDQVREELVHHNQILKLHSERIGKKEYFDGEFHILTQDFIYAVTKYLTPASVPAEDGGRSGLFLTAVQLQPVKKTPTFKGQYVDYVAKQRRNKRLGDRGEDLVFRHLQDKYGDRVEHKSKTEGDGLGYDILSVDEDGNPTYIEVKTTRGGPGTAFYVSQNELAWSREQNERYQLWRLYDFDEESGTARYFVLEGDLSRYCINPLQFEVALELKDVDRHGQITGEV